VEIGDSGGGLPKEYRDSVFLSRFPCLQGGVVRDLLSCAGWVGPSGIVAGRGGEALMGGGGTFPSARGSSSLCPWSGTEKAFGDGPQAGKAPAGKPPGRRVRAVKGRSYRSAPRGSGCADGCGWRSATAAAAYPRSTGTAFFSPGFPVCRGAWSGTCSRAPDGSDHLASWPVVVKKHWWGERSLRRGDPHRFAPGPGLTTLRRIGRTISHRGRSW